MNERINQEKMEIISSKLGDFGKKVRVICENAKKLFTTWFGVLEKANNEIIILLDSGVMFGILDSDDEKED